MNRKIKKAMLVGICTTLLLPGCRSKITEGTVYRKEYVPAHTETRLIPMSTYNGKTTSIHMIPMTENEPDKWIIYIESIENEERRTAQYRVSEEEYEEIEIGSIVSFDKGEEAEMNQ